MSIDKLLLTQNTTLEQVTDYFKDLGPDKQVRARKIGGGQIELYVRKDSFKQFFTDKLRSGFLVARDYKEARTRILTIMSQAKLPAEELSSVHNIKQSIGLHKHNFYANKVNNEFKKLSEYLTKQTQAKEVLDSIKVRIKMPEGDENFEELGNFKAYVIKSQETLGLNLNNSLINSQSEHLFNFLQEKYVLQKEGDSENDIGNNVVPVFIDYEAIEDFGLTWQESITQTKNHNGKKTKTSGQSENLVFEEGYLTKLSKEIFLASELQKMNVRQSKNVPIQIDLMPKSIEGTDAAYVVIDPNNTASIHTQLSMLPVDVKSSVIFLENSDISITIKDQISIAGNRNLFDLLRIDYPDDTMISSQDLDKLYETIFQEILNRIPSGLKDPSTAPDATQLVELPIAMHIPILLLSEKPEENQRRKDEILNSFAKATKNLTLTHPHLRIKVQIPKEISIEDVYDAYNRVQ
jgi:hypothetical protein